MSFFPRRPLCCLLAAGALVACSSEAPPDPAPVPAEAGGAGGAGGAGAGGEGGAGEAGSGTSGQSGVSGEAGAGAGGEAGAAGEGGAPGCYELGTGTCCSEVKCYSPDELTKLGCTVVDLQTEGCPYPVELPMGDCYWYEESTRVEEGKCCYTHVSGDCCGP